MRRTLTTCLILAVATPALAQTRTTIMQPVPSSDAAIVSAPIEYDSNGVAKAQYFKADDLTPEQLRALLAEADRVRAYQQVNGVYVNPNAPASTTAATTTVIETAPAITTTAPYTTEIELYETPIAPVATYANQTHTVIKGDTLYNISKRYGVSVTDLQQANGISGSSISLGQSIQIPARQATTYTAYQSSSNVGYTSSTMTNGGYVTRRIVEPVPAPATVRSVTSATDTVYAVLPKDTLYAISRRTCTQVAALIAANGISNPNDLKPGQSLTIPAGHCLTN